MMNNANPASSSSDPQLLPIIVGVTGHRDLRPEDIPNLEQAVEDIFVALHKQYPDTSLLLLSPLAEGADRLVARIGLKPGADKQQYAQLVVPLPLPQTEYEKDFHTLESREEFKRLLEEATKCFALPLMPDNTPENILRSGPHRDRQYAQVGAYIVRHSQILIALWDGARQRKEEESVGGTAQIVRFKLEGISQPYASTQNPLDVIDTGPVYHILTPRVRNPHPEGEAFSLDIKFPLDGEDVQLQPRSYDQILERMNLFNRDANNLSAQLEEKIKKSKEDLLPEKKAVGLSHTACTVLEQYALADTLATYFQGWRRRILIWLFVIAVLAVVSFEVYAHLLGSPFILLLYLLTLGAAFFLYLRATRQNYQNKHLDYRALAEGLRVQLFWHLAGLPDEVAEHYLRQHRSELEWIRNAIRAWNVPAVQPCAEGDLMNIAAITSPPAPPLIDLVLEHWVEGQRQFFTNATTRDHKKLHRHERIVDCLFIFGLLLASSVVALDFTLHHSEAYSRWHHLLIVIMGTAPAIAAAMGGYAEKMAFAAQERRYRWMRSLFARASTQLQTLLNENKLHAAQQLILDLGKEALEENGDWVLTHRERTWDYRKS